MHPYVRKLKNFLKAHANPEEAAPMKAYMRDQFEYLGLKTPERSALMKQFIAENGLPALADLDAIVRDLWSLPEREYQYVAMGLIGRFTKKLPPEFISTLEYCLITKSWWDTVDGIPMGEFFKQHPKVRSVYLPKWRKSENIWLRRISLLFQLGYKQDTDFDLLCEIIRENLGSKEFFINKAIGWALRQYTRVDPEGVRKFVAETPLHPLSAREALKWLEKKNKK